MEALAAQQGFPLNRFTPQLPLHYTSVGITGGRRRFSPLRFSCAHYAFMGAWPIRENYLPLEFKKVKNFDMNQF